MKFTIAMLILCCLTGAFVGCKTAPVKQITIYDRYTGSSVTIDEDGITDLNVGSTMVAGRLVIKASEKKDGDTPINAEEYFEVEDE